MQKPRKRRKRWQECPSCHQLVFAQVNSLGHHRCNDAARAKKEAELDMVIDEELSTWDEDVAKFWKSKDVRFYGWLADNDRL